MADLEKRPASPPSGVAQYQAQYLSKKNNGDMADMAICASPSGASYNQKLKRGRRKELGVWDTLRTTIVHHQIGISINLLLLLTFTHLTIPAARPTTAKFFNLQYPTPSRDAYTRGNDDIYYVLTWIIIFTGLREFTMSYLLKPCASLAGISKPKTQTRFAEQAWLVLYYALFWSLGMHIYATSDYWLDMPQMWAGFPDLFMDGIAKRYYLIQFAFWVQQIVVVHIEERRKDHWQMFTHHIVTCALLLSSYGYYQTRVGNVILVLMDVVDLVFPTAKMLKYAGYQTACDVAFGVFILSWFAARHVAYLTICWSVYYDTMKMMKFGCYSSTTGEMISLTPPTDSRFSQQPGPNGAVPAGGTDIWSNIVQPYAYPGEPICYNSKMKFLFLGLLLFLQGITIMWFVMIIRVAYRVLKGQGADDSRSDDEGDDEEEDELDIEDVALEKPLKPVEQVVGVEGLNIKRKSSPMSGRFSAVKKEGGGSSTGIVKKEILNRIGCEQHVD